MSETLDKMKEKFAPYQVPEMLQQLCIYWDKNPHFFSGSFEVSSDEYDTVQAWFQDIEAGYSQVRVFGHDGIASLYGFWLKDGRTPDKAPVIYLGGEGEGTTVIAQDFAEFLSLLAANRDYEPFDANFCDEEESAAEWNQKFCVWLKKKYNIDRSPDPMVILKRARKKYPDFNKWLSEVVPGWS